MRTSPTPGVVLSIHAATVLAGAASARAAPTAAVSSEMDVSLPESFAPVTTTRINEPTSSGSTTRYVLSVAPSMSAQAPKSPLSLHRCHWYANVGAGTPSHEPGSAVRTSPTLGVVLSIHAASVFAGAAGATSTIAVNSEAAVSLPESFAPVTTTRIEAPTSSGSTS